MQHNKIADTHLFLLSLTKCPHEKNIEKAFFMSAGPQNESETAGSGDTLSQCLYQNIYRIQKKISSKIYIYVKYICLTFN